MSTLRDVTLNPKPVQVVREGDYVVDAGSMYGQTALGLSKVALLPPVPPLL